MKRGLHHEDCLEDDPVQKNDDVSMMMIVPFFWLFRFQFFSLTLVLPLTLKNISFKWLWQLAFASCPEAYLGFLNICNMECFTTTVKIASYALRKFMCLENLPS